MEEKIILFYSHKFETLNQINNFQTFFSPSANVIDWSDWIFIGAPLSKAALKLAHNSLSTPFKRKKIPRNSYLKLHTLREKCPYSEFLWYAFSAFGLNTETYRVSLRIQSERGKIRTRKTSNTDTFYAVIQISFSETVDRPLRRLLQLSLSFKVAATQQPPTLQKFPYLFFWTRLGFEFRNTLINLSVPNASLCIGNKWVNLSHNKFRINLRLKGVRNKKNTCLMHFGNHSYQQT